MNKFKRRFTTLLSLLFLAQLTYAQSGGENNYLLISLISLVVVMLLFAILSVSNNLIQVEAKNAGVDLDKKNSGVLSSAASIFDNTKPPSYMKEGSFYKFKKGFDLKLVGDVKEASIEQIHASRYAIRPIDFNGISPIPKVVLEVGGEVKAGDVLFFDKKRPEIQYVSPVSGEIVEVRRGAKRAITEVIILADKDVQYKSLNAPSLANADREAVRNFLIENGGWTLINERPFDVVPEIDTVPRDIFISTFDTAPLALDYNLVVNGNEEAFQAGLDALNTLTDGSVYLGLDARKGKKPADAFINATGVKTNYFKGVHPAGNVGIQIHHVSPIKPGDKVWTLGVQDVITIGKMFTEGKFDASRVVAIVGDKINTPKNVRTYVGASIADLTAGNVKEGNNRIIAGDVFSGEKVNNESFLPLHADQITVIEEGDYYEPFGWLLPKLKASNSKTFPSFILPNHKYKGDTNTHGEQRAFVVTGEYEDVLPMNIYPQHLMKAIMTGDFEKMEGLGINELTEEDVAVCEFVCTSKMPLQQILREGLDMMKEQA